MTAVYTTVFCDDIRQEANGKHLLIGVYGTDMVPGVLPQVFPLSVWVKIDPVPRGPKHFRLTIRSPIGDESGIEGDMNVPDEAPSPGIVLAVGALPVQVTQPGTIVALLAFDGGEPEEIGRLGVTPVGGGR